MSVINLPTKEQFDRMNGYLSVIADMGNVKLLDAYDVQRAIRNETIQKILSIGDFFTVGRGGTDWLFQVAAFDYDIPVKSQYTKSMRLLMYPVFTNVAFDAPEAIYFAATALPAGSYWLKDSRTSKYFSFTLTQAVPANGQIVYSGYGSSESGYLPPSVRTYASQTSTTAIETAIITVADDEPAVGTELTTLNEGNRGRFGSGNWLDSAIRQWLNSDKASGWWVPSNIYDRPQSSPTAGFLHGIDQDLLDCIGKVRLRTGLAPYDNEETFGYSDNEELIFLPSRTEMGLGNSATNIYETPVTAEGVAKTDTLPIFKSNADQIKYLNGVARSWWLRSPSPNSTYAGNAYFVDSTGVLSGNSAFLAIGAVPACTIY